MSAPKDASPRPSRAPRVPILFEDRWLVAIDKPAGLPSVPSEGVSGRTCVSELRVTHPTAQPVHRIDRDVSGVLLFALDDATRAALEQQFRERSLDKTYLAVVAGLPRPQAGTIRKPIADLGKHARIGGPPAARAVTHYKVVERLGGGVGRGAPPVSLVEVQLETGRYNQIRLHFASIGHPLIGERKYARGRESPVRFRRVALHAWKLAFDHPHGGVRLQIESPLPVDLRRLIDELSSRD